jgi:hypothetical protein
MPHDQEMSATNKNLDDPSPPAYRAIDRDGGYVDEPRAPQDEKDPLAEVFPGLDSDPNTTYFQFGNRPQSVWKEFFSRSWKPFWETVLEIRGTDIPNLLADGLCLSLAHFDMDSRYVIRDNRSLPMRYGCQHPKWKTTTVFKLRDFGSDPAWEANLLVFTAGCEIKEFKFSTITTWMMRYVWDCNGVAKLNWVTRAPMKSCILIRTASWNPKTRELKRVLPTTTTMKDSH